MKTLLFALTFLFSAPAFSLTCLAGIWHDPDGDPLDNSDLVLVNIPWSQIQDFDKDIPGFEFVMFKVLLDTPNGQGTSIVSNRDEYAVKYFPNVQSKEALRISIFQDAPVFGQRILLINGDAINNAQALFQEPPRQGHENSVLLGADTSGLVSVPAGQLFDDLHDRAFALDVGLCN